MLLLHLFVMFKCFLAVWIVTTCRLMQLCKLWKLQTINRKIWLILPHFWKYLCMNPIYASCEVLHFRYFYFCCCMQFIKLWNDSLFFFQRYCKNNLKFYCICMFPFFGSACRCHLYFSGYIREMRKGCNVRPCTLSRYIQ